MLAECKVRLEAQVPEAAGRTGLASSFQRYRSGKAQLSGGVHFFILPDGMSGQPASIMTGVFVQPVVRQIAVVTAVRSNDKAGEAALDRIQDIVAGVHAAFCGWAPGDTVGVFEFGQERVLTSEVGILAYTTTFRIQDQLRFQT